MAGPMDFLHNNSMGLTQMGLGLLSGKTGTEQAALGAQGLAGALQNNKTVKFLQSSNPELAQAVMAGAISPGDAWKLAYQQKLEAQKPANSFQTLPDGTYGFADPRAGTFNALGKVDKPMTLPASVQEYEYAKSQGFKGSITDYEAAKREKGGDKAPTGFRWADESQTSLEPIPGGPGEQVSGELAARVGMADNFQAQLPSIRQKVAEGKVTGLIDRGIAAIGRGEQGEVFRQIQSGVDALQRLLTGAGMNIAEAEAYAARYQPSWTDDQATVLSKLDQLSAELEATKGMALRGRGGQPGGVNTPQAGVVDYTDYFK